MNINTPSFRIVSSVVFACFIFFAIGAPVRAIGPAGVTVPAGTVVALSLEQSITSEMPVGSSVNFRVIYDVKVDGQVVVRAGSIATGSIASVKGTGAVGSPGRVAITLRTVRAVDGQEILLRGNMNKEGDDKVVLSVILALICLPLILIHGEDAEIPAGTEVRAYVEQEYTINT
ncbi:MAG TPA: hypothetical protein PK916_17165 [Bacteroidota bacterium]|nr:hypothetical protein [Bacteroidota bacterium]